MPPLFRMPQTRVRENRAHIRCEVEKNEGRGKDQAAGLHDREVTFGLRIHMQLANDQIDRIYLYQDAFILNSPDELFFNQIKGRDIVAYFVDGEVRRVKVDGNAESVYYALDEAKAYVAANKTVCSEMLLFFGNNTLHTDRQVFVRLVVSAHSYSN